MMTNLDSASLSAYRASVLNGGSTVVPAHHLSDLLAAYDAAQKKRGKPGRPPNRRAPVGEDWTREMAVLDEVVIAVTAALGFKGDVRMRASTKEAMIARYMTCAVAHDLGVHTAVIGAGLICRANSVNQFVRVFSSMMKDDAALADTFSKAIQNQKVKVA